MFKKIAKEKTRKLLSLVSIATATLILPNTATATIVEFYTSQGNFQVNLFDQTTPKTVDNFLTYVESEHYSDSVIHRVATDFVVQGGGYTFEGVWPLTPLEANESVVNEPIYSNVLGTIAMAKIGSDMNSATNQWFFNLADNSENLDQQNGGFTVFGQVIGDGMTVVNKIAGLDLCTYDSLTGIPMVMGSEQICSDMLAPGVENFVVIEQVVIVDSSAVTDSDLSPQLSIYPDSDTDTDDSGGSTTWLTLVMLSLFAVKKRLKLY
ncbi:MAG: peptidylprolyl isomerase [Colwellia sp.]